MSDVSTTLSLAGSLPTQRASQDKPFGLWATLAWTAAAMVGLFSYMIFGYAAKRWLGHPIALPAWVDIIPIGHIMMLAVVLLAVRISGVPMRYYLAVKRISKRQVWTAVGLGVVTFFGMSALYMLTGLIQKALGGAPIDMVGLVSGFGNDKWTIILSIWIGMVVAAPIAEELLYRGFMYRGLAESRLGAAGAIVLTAIVFGAGHAPGFGWQRVVVTGLCGAVWAIQRQRTGSTAAGIISHATTNFIGAIVIALMVLAVAS